MMYEAFGVDLSYTEGSWRDTFNGLMGFYSGVYPVIASLVAVSLGVLSISRVWGIRLMAVLLVVAYFPTMIYFPLSISAVHPETSFWEVWIAGLATVPLQLAIYSVIYVANKGFQMLRR